MGGSKGGEATLAYLTLRSKGIVGYHVYIYVIMGIRCCGLKYILLTTNEKRNTICNGVILYAKEPIIGITGKMGTKSAGHCIVVGNFPASIFTR